MRHVTEGRRTNKLRDNQRSRTIGNRNKSNYQCTYSPSPVPLVFLTFLDLLVNLVEQVVSLGLREMVLGNESLSQLITESKLS
jgi:hypothetical protein